MRSIRTKITTLIIVSMSVSFIAAAIVAGVSIADFGHNSAERELALLAETGKNNLNYYFKSVEQSVNTVSSLIDDDLDRIPDEDFAASFSQHMERARGIFAEAANHANGVFTYYYRIDPSISDVTEEKGFWYIDLDGKGFEEHEVSDLSDKSLDCVWFYDTKKAGAPIWLAPYVTDNLNVYVVSYNVPVYRNGSFVGVAGIEIDYHTLGEQIDTIKAMNTGYALIIENEGGSIVYHPYIDILSLPKEERPAIPEEFLDNYRRDEHHCTYTFQGVRKHCYWLKLSNGMSIVVAVPEAEVNKTWVNMTLIIVFVSLGVIALFTVLTILSSRRIVKPLRDLTRAAEEIDKGNYDVKLDYKGDDEIGALTETFNKLIRDLDGYIGDLTSLAYADALTSVNNKSAFDIAVEEMQKRIDDPDDDPRFAIAILDCDDLKTINDAHGHDKGDIYLRNSCHFICRVFAKSVVYRVGGDEFAIILQGDDYQNRERLRETFVSRSREICAFAKQPWENVKVSIGIADYDPAIDSNVHDVMVHADHLMYTDKRIRKKQKA